jgi:segregation and condensation protein B
MEEPMTKRNQEHAEPPPSTSQIQADVEGLPEIENPADSETSPYSQGPADLPEQDPDFEPTVESVIEAVLFASDEPLSPARLADVVETGTKQVRDHVEALNEKYRANKNAFRIEQIAGGYQMLTLSPYNHWLRKLLRARSDSKLSPAALETLAIIAYKQPVIRADIEAIRGVAAGEVIRSLMYKGLVKIVGRAEVLGRPMLYGTTKKFLEVFGLNSLKDLPKVEELKAPSS